MIQLIKNNPATGWVRADQVPDETATIEILKLKRQIEILEEEFDKLSNEAPPGAEQLCQGGDLVEIKYNFKVGRSQFDFKGYTDVMSICWDDIYSRLSPLLIGESDEDKLKTECGNLIRERTYRIHREDQVFDEQSIFEFRIINDHFQTIKIQLRALGLIERSLKSRGVKDTATYWTLTAYGDSVMNNLRALRRDVIPETSAESEEAAS